MEYKLAMVDNDCLFCKLFREGTGGKVTKLVRDGIEFELGVVVEPMSSVSCILATADI